MRSIIIKVNPTPTLMLCLLVEQKNMVLASFVATILFQSWIQGHNKRYPRCLINLQKNATILKSNNKHRSLGFGNIQEPIHLLNHLRSKMHNLGSHYQISISITFMQFLNRCEEGKVSLWNNLWFVIANMCIPSTAYSGMCNNQSSIWCKQISIPTIVK